MPKRGAEQGTHRERELKPKYPILIESHATTWHDGGVAVLFGDGHIEVLAAERVGDRFKHSFNSRLAYDHLIVMHQGDAMFTLKPKNDHFVDPKTGLEITTVLQRVMGVSP